MRKVLLIAVITFVVLFGGLLIAPSFVDWNVYKGQVTNQVNAATGRDLVIDGDLSLTLIPRPTLVASGVRVGNIDGASAPDMIRLRTALVRVALTPLLRGQIAVDSVVLVQPQIALERLADGRVNWSFTPEPEEASAPPSPAPSDGGLSLPPIAFNNISIEDGTIVFRDAQSGDIRRFERINATVAAGSLEGPFRAAGSVNALGVPFELRADIGRLAEDRAIPVSAGIEMADGATAAEFSGILSGFPIEPRLTGQLTAEGNGATSLLGGLFGSAVGELADRKLSLVGEVSATPAGVAVTGIEFTLGESRATGTVSVALQPDIAGNVTLNVTRLDLDALLGESEDTPRDEPSPRTDAPIEVVPGAQAAGGFTFPKDVELSVDASVDAIIYRENIIRQARLAGQLVNGELTVSQASAQLPGGADVVLFGFVTTAEGEPVFEGQVESNADNLRGLLSWLGTDTDGVPADRLRKMELTADIRATPAQLTISNADAQIDLSRVRGGVAVALRERPGLGIGFSIDKLNLDAYLAEAPTAAEEAPAPDQTAETATEETPPAPGIDLSALAFLDTFDSIVQFQIGSLTYRKLPIQGVNFDGTLQNGKLEIRQANIVDLAGTTLKASGELTDLGTEVPAVTLDIDVDSQSAGPLFEALGIEPAPGAVPATLAANITGNATDLTIDTNLSMQGLTVEAAGRLTDLAGGPGYDLQLTARHDSSADLMAMLTDGSPGRADLGAVQLTGRVQGDQATANVDLSGQFGPGELSIAGDIANLNQAPSADLQLNVAYPDLQQFVRLFSPNYRAALTELGEFRLAAAARYEPAGITLSGLQGAIGPVALQGDASVALDGPRPRLVANLSTSEIIADWFLAPVAVAAAPAASGGAPAGQSSAVQPDAVRWSSEPLDLSALQSFDAELTIDTPGLSYAAYSVAQPQVKLMLDDGKLQLERLSGKAFDGDFSMTAAVDAGDRTNAEILVSVVGADAAKLTAAAQQGRQAAGGGDVVGGVLELLFPVSAIKLQSGTIGAELGFSAAGATELELVSNLNGSGELSFTNAVIDGFDVCRLSAQLGDLNGIESILGLALTADGGTTTVKDFVGRFDVVNGIADLPRQQLDAECALAQISGQVDLPRWLVDLGMDLSFPEHAQFPGIEIEERGPLNAPNVRLVNLNEIQQYFVGRAAEGLLRELVPGDRVEPTPEPVQQQPTVEAPASPNPAQAPNTAEAPAPVEAEPESPADPFIKLLDTLINR